MHDLRVEAVPWWAVLAASASPVLLVGGFLAAAALQPSSYNPVRDTISQLAGDRATDPWVMTSVLLAVGSCYLIASLGLRPAGPLSRSLLAAGGLATLAIALFRLPDRGYSVGHEVAVVLAALTCSTWPAFAWRPRLPAPLLTRRRSYEGTAVLVGLVVWYALETHGLLLGVAERCAAAGPPLWLCAVTLTTRRATRRRAAETSRGRVSMSGSS